MAHVHILPQERWLMKMWVWNDMTRLMTDRLHGQSTPVFDTNIIIMGYEIANVGNRIRYDSKNDCDACPGCEKYTI